ncbi:hypothetical protein SCLCIDRAFT_1222124 [Scleroderma citrinum Foug A]|uniref:Uncharacterized protein n=1 Tax=Scleroderma citrinum Foug A TaxID=1036808 RepID=A0A0C3D0G6_9AGAM|nr:hypothetical protein SCLCIDRAFT_1222124 [Scleroderma citrinum Foug A]
MPMCIVVSLLHLVGVFAFAGFDTSSHDICTICTPSFSATTTRPISTTITDIDCDDPADALLRRIAAACTLARQTKQALCYSSKTKSSN